MNSSAVVHATAAVQRPLLRSHSTGNNCAAVATVADNLAIECRNLSYSVKTRQGRLLPILNDCSLSIPSGQFWMLLGPNGCGKSTLLKVVMPTVEADVAFGLGKFNLANDEITSRVAKALDAVGMYEYLQRPVQTLSGGQKQRVAIAGALAEACKVLLLDELTSFLDENDQYADGAVYMEDGKVVLQGDASSILNFVEAQQGSYIKQINS
ncbi:hypothetical protein DH2020_006759 [Rehmannia glutinosa]|uniref:ABC transporter domain-containing protein n=1 Tax=Rehmannia glutinosa TaxID=99300 RepID=A0ABR0XJU1_REHGL